MAADDDARYRYRPSHGEFLQGVPARDLTAADLAALTPDARQTLDAYLSTGGNLYTPAGGQSPRAGK